MVTIGLDLGGTVVKMALISEGKIINQRKVPSPSNASLQAFLPDLEKHINQMLQESNISADGLAGIGVSIPGIVDTINMRVITVNDKFAGSEQPDLRVWAKDKWNVPLVMENDARCALIGEWQYGKGVGYDNVVIVTLGTGFGSSAVIDGKVLRGKHFLAGILGGHFIIDWYGLPCNCGNQGCVEALSSTWNLKMICRQFADYEGSELQKTDQPDFKLIFERAKKGDALAERILDHCMDAWTHGIVNLIYAYDPEIVILSGGIMANASVIMPYIKEKIKKFGWAPFDQIKFEVAENVNVSSLLSAEYLIKSFKEK